MLPRILLVACCLLVAQSAIAEEILWRTGAGFQAELNSPFTANWQHVELRAILQQISQSKRLAIVLDRRVDPSATPQISLAKHPLKIEFHQLAEEIHCGDSFPENVIYLGPPSSAQKLRTLIALRKAELANPAWKISKSRQQQWLKSRTIHWPDLESPQDILNHISAEWDITIQGIDQIEHDLWAQSTLPQVHGIAALSLILIQFDRTFTFRDQGRAIEICPIPETVRITRAHKVSPQSAEKTLTHWKAEWPELEFKISGKEILAEATVEQHEELAAGKSPRSIPTKPDAVVPLEQRTFTLTVKDVSARDVMRELEKSGIQFVFDEQKLSDAGVNLNQFVEFDVRKVSADPFFHALFDPLTVEFKIDGVTVTLSPQ